MNVDIRFLFTYWVLALTILYFIAVWGFHSRYVEENFNPLFITICEAIITAVVSLYGLLSGIKLNGVAIMYICINLITKGIPIYLLRNSRIDYVKDAFKAAVLGIIYYLYLLVNGKNLYKVYSPIYNSVLNGTYKPILLTI